MYVVYKKESNEQTTRINNVVDALFAGLDTDYNADIDTTRRTKTVLVDDYSNGPITLENICTVMRIIINLAESHPHPEEEYIHFNIPKKTGGLRPIDAPNENLKKDMRRIAGLMQYCLKLQYHDSAWAYRKGRDVVGATKEHLDNKSNWYLKIDLHNFFGSCTKEFILQQLKQVYPFAQYKDNEVVKLGLDKLVDLSLLNGSLPQGTPLSPMITNLIMIPIDYKITKLLNTLVGTGSIPKQRYVYTRYADDIIISAKVSFNHNIIVDVLKELFEAQTPLTINETKTRYGSIAGRNWNLGVMCNKEYKATIGYRKKQELKVAVHNFINNQEDWELKDLQWLLGQFSWLSNVEQDYYIGFMNYINKKYNTDVRATLLNLIKTYNN